MCTEAGAREWTPECIASWPLYSRVSWRDASPLTRLKENMGYGDTSLQSTQWKYSQTRKHHVWWNTKVVFQKTLRSLCFSLSQLFVYLFSCHFFLRKNRLLLHHCYCPTHTHSTIALLVLEDIRLGFGPIIGCDYTLQTWDIAHLHAHTHTSGQIRSAQLDSVIR